MTWSAKLAPWPSVADAGRAVDFCKSAFGAVEPERLEVGIEAGQPPASRRIADITFEGSAPGATETVPAGQRALDPVRPS